MKEVSGILSNEARENMEAIRKVAYQIWGSNCEFEDVDIKS